MNHQTLAAAAARVTADAMRIARHVQATMPRGQAVTKDDRSPVTIADFAVQAHVARALRDAFPDVPLVGEERADVLRDPAQASLLMRVVEAVRVVRADATPSSVLEAIDLGDHDASGSRYWTLDPVDGTKGFLRRQQFAIALAMIEKGTVVVGTLGCPNLPDSDTGGYDEPHARGSLFLGVRGSGAWLVDVNDASSPRRVVRAAQRVDRGALRVCESVESGHSDQEGSARLMASLGAVGAPRRLDSQCKYALVARGSADVYLRLPTRAGYEEKIWDHAAGTLIAEEAGARVSDVHGSPLDFSRGTTLSGNAGVVCAAAAIHAEIVDALRRASA